jgi:5-methylcytosine-specific restriction protein A
LSKTGKRNPNWTREELILALDLYFRCDVAGTGPDDPEIVALSELLNRLPIHDHRSEYPTFRNPAGVYMKLCNFLRLDPEYRGVGLRAGSHLDIAVWEEFAQDRSRLHAAAAAIRAGAGGL